MSVFLDTLSLLPRRQSQRTGVPACRFRPNPQVDKETSPKSKLDADGSVGSKFKSDGKVCQAILHMCI